MCEPLSTGDGYRFMREDGQAAGRGEERHKTRPRRQFQLSDVRYANRAATTSRQKEEPVGWAQRLMAIVAEGQRGRVYLSPTVEMEEYREKTQNPRGSQNSELRHDPTHSGRVLIMGLTTVSSDLFTRRQLVALTTFSDLVTEAREKIRRDALAAGWPTMTKVLTRWNRSHSLCGGHSCVSWLFACREVC